MESSMHRGKSKWLVELFCRIIFVVYGVTAWIATMTLAHMKFA